jgi:hypothetical protein
MNEDKIKITITGSEERLKKLLEHIEFGNTTPFREEVAQIRAQLLPNERRKLFYNKSP